MFYFNCEAGSWTIQCFARKKSSLKKMVRDAVRSCIGPDGLAHVMREYPSDFDTSEAQDFSWIDGKDFTLLDCMEVVNEGALR